MNFTRSLSFALVLLTGCMFSGKKRIDYVDDIHSTSSMCINGLLVGMRSAGCNDIKVSHLETAAPFQEGLVYSCEKSTQQEFWTSSRFLVVTPPPRLESSSIEWIPLCNDTDIWLFVEEVD